MTAEILIVKQAYTGKVLAKLQMHDSAQVDSMLSTAQALHKEVVCPHMSVFVCCKSWLN